MMAECATKDGTTLRAKLALEIPAVPLEARFDSSVPCLLISRGSGAGQVNCQGAGKLKALSSKSDPIFKERTHVKDITSTMGRRVIFRASFFIIFISIASALASYGPTPSLSLTLFLL